jgi:hypothetical protein
MEEVVNKEKDECILMSKTPQPRIDLLNYGSRALLAKQRNQILTILGIIFL